MYIWPEMHQGRAKYHIEASWIVERNPIPRGFEAEYRKGFERTESVEPKMSGVGECFQAPQGVAQIVQCVLNLENLEPKGTSLWHQGVRAMGRSLLL